MLVGIQEIYNKKKEIFCFEEQNNENKEIFIEDLTQKDTEKKEFQSCEKTENKDGTKTKFILKTFSAEENLEEDTTEQEIIAQEKKRKAENEKRDASLARWLARLRLERKRLLQGKTEIQKKEESIEIRERKQNQNINLRTSLTSERIALLDEIGMVWDAPDFIWEQHFAVAEEYYKKYGSLDVPTYYVNADGIRLGKWIAKQRKQSNLTKEQVFRLSTIGMIWKKKHYATWEKSYAAACRYYKKYGNLDVPTNYITEDGIRLGRWVRRQRETYRETTQKCKKDSNKFFPTKIDIKTNYPLKNQGSFEIAKDREKKWTQNIIQNQKQKDSLSEISVVRIKKLEQIGMIWEQDNSWERRYQLAEKYYKAYGNLKIPADYVVEGVWLGRWIWEQKARLEISKNLDFERLPQKENKEKILKSKNQNLTRKARKPLTLLQREKLSAIGLYLEVSQTERSWQQQYTEAEKFYQKHGNLSIPKQYVGTSGKNLGVWIQHQREGKRRGRLAEWQVAMMERIGMIWEFDDPWEIGYQHAQNYFAEKGDLAVPNTYICSDGYRLGKWISNQRCAYHGVARKGLEQDKVRKLEEIGMSWKAKPGRVKKSFYTK